jgi:hypothetical protein
MDKKSKKKSVRRTTKKLKTKIKNFESDIKKNNKVVLYVYVDKDVKNFVVSRALDLGLSKSSYVEKAINFLRENTI